MNIHYMNIHEHVWIWYGYVLMCVHVHQCMFMYMYLLSSSKLREQKRNYIIYGACRRIIEFNGTTKRLSRALRTPLNSGGFHLVIPCWATNFRSFMMFSQGFCCRMKRMWWWPYRGCIHHSHLIHIWFHSHDHGQRTLAATMAVYSSQESPALALEVNLSISFYSLVDT